MNSSSMQHRSSARGNVVFLVLIGVILLASLIYALTSGARQSSNAANQEQARLYADEIIEYGNGLRPVIDRMIMLGGVIDTDIFFAASGANAAYGTVGAAPAKEVFNIAGGGAVYNKPTPSACRSACAYEFTGQYTVGNVQTAAPELSMVVVDIAPLVCQKMNEIQNNGWTTVPTDATLSTLARFNGSTYGAATAITMGATFNGKRAFCYHETGGGQRYIYVHVLRGR